MLLQIDLDRLLYQESKNHPRRVRWTPSTGRSSETDNTGQTLNQFNQLIP